MNITLIRVLFYALSSVLVSLVPLMLGYGVNYADGMIIINLEALIGAVLTSLGLSGAVFAKWGTR